MRAAAQRYSAVAIVLHWAIAAAIAGNVLLGWWMHQAIERPQAQARAIAAFQLHKSLGLTVLVLSLFRLVWRWTHRPPPLAAGMPLWEKIAAKATHWAFYALMIGLPLSGWSYVSTQWRGNAPLNIPTLWFGVFEVPHLFGLDETARGTREALAGVALDIHVLLVWSTVALFVLHVAAALKHQFVNRDGVLGHMIPALQATDGTAPMHDRRRAAILTGGFAAIARGRMVRRRKSSRCRISRDAHPPARRSPPPRRGHADDQGPHPRFVAFDPRSARQPGDPRRPTEDRPAQRRSGHGIRRGRPVGVA